MEPPCCATPYAGTKAANSAPRGEKWSAQSSVRLRDSWSTAAQRTRFAAPLCGPPYSSKRRPDAHGQRPRRRELVAVEVLVHGDLDVHERGVILVHFICHAGAEINHRTAGVEVVRLRACVAGRQAAVDLQFG